MFSLAEHGVRGINFHGGGKCWAGGYSPICTDRSHFVARPLYYALLFFRHAGIGRIMPVTYQSPVNISAHAALADDGKLRVTLINKDEQQSIAVQLQPGQAYSSASAMRLSGLGLQVRMGVEFAGSEVNEDGTWFPEIIEPVVKDGDGFVVALPAASAVVVTLEK